MTSHKILLSGASGMLGTALVRVAEANRISALRLVRHEPANSSEIRWNPEASQAISDLAPLEGIDAVIHLSGANIAGHRWTPAYKREIFASRIGTTRALVSVLKSLKKPPPAFLCASATGIYGDRGDEILSETSQPGGGFLAETCLAWETEAAQARTAGIRVVHLRFGVVLDRDGGAVKKMLPLFRLGLGGNLGDGRQWMSWIALSDVVRALFDLVKLPTADGPFNFVAPDPITNADFTLALARALHRPAIVPAPAFALRLAFGEIADQVLLASARVVPDRFLRSGFTFELPDIASALDNILHPIR